MDLRAAFPREAVKALLLESFKIELSTRSGTLLQGLIFDKQFFGFFFSFFSLLNFNLILFFVEGKRNQQG